MTNTNNSNAIAIKSCQDAIKAQESEIARQLELPASEDRRIAIANLEGCIAANLQRIAARTIS